ARSGRRGPDGRLPGERGRAGRQRAPLPLLRRAGGADLASPAGEDPLQVRRQLDPRRARAAAARNRRRRPGQSGAAQGEGGLTMGGRLQGKAAVVTGAGRGIGRAIAELLAVEGAAVVVNDLGTAVDGSGAGGAVADDVVAAIKARGGRAVANHDSVADYAAAE